MWYDKMAIIFYFYLSRTFAVLNQDFLLQKYMIGYLFFAAMEITEFQFFQFCNSEGKISFRDIFLTNYLDFASLRH